MSDWKHKFIIWGRPNCPWCDRAKEYITDWGDRYEYVELTPENMDEFTRLFPGMKTVPQIIHTGEFVPDFHIKGYEALLEFYKR